MVDFDGVKDEEFIDWEMVDFNPDHVRKSFGL